MPPLPASCLEWDGERGCSKDTSPFLSEWEDHTQPPPSQTIKGLVLNGCKCVCVVGEIRMEGRSQRWGGGVPEGSLELCFSYSQKGHPSSLEDLEGVAVELLTFPRISTNSLGHRMPQLSQSGLMPKLAASLRDLFSKSENLDT